MLSMRRFAANVLANGAAGNAMAAWAPSRIISRSNVIATARLSTETSPSVAAASKVTTVSDYAMVALVILFFLLNFT